MYILFVKRVLDVSVLFVLKNDRNAANKEFDQEYFSKALILFKKAIMKQELMQNNGNTDDDESDFKFKKAELYFRAAKASFELQEYALSRDYMSIAMSLDNKNIQFKNQYVLAMYNCGDKEGALNFIQDHDTVVFDDTILKMIANEFTNDTDYTKKSSIPTRLKFAIEFIDEKRGRGIIATENICKGETILIEKPFAMSQPYDSHARSNLQIKYINISGQDNNDSNNSNDCDDDLKQIDIIFLQDMLHRLYYNDIGCDFEKILFEEKYCNHFIKKQLERLRISLLFNGDENDMYTNKYKKQLFELLLPRVGTRSSLIDDDNDELNSKTLKPITAEDNTYLFQYETPLDNDYLKQVFQQEKNNHVWLTAANLQNVFFGNAYETEPLREKSNGIMTQYLARSGLYLIVSFFNHSENANAIWQICHDNDNIMILTARRDIQIGQEICTNYLGQHL